MKKQGSWYSRLSFKKRNTLWGIIFLLPWIFGFVAFFVRPIFNTLLYSFNDITLSLDGLNLSYIGLANFVNALTVNADFNKSLVTAVVESLVNVPTMILVSMFVAMLLNGDYKGRGLARLVFFIPIILATGLTGMEMQNTTVEVAEEASQSIINVAFLSNLFVKSGIPAEIVTYITTIVSTIFEVVSVSGIQMLIFLSGLQGISPALYEVAKIEGCTSYETFCKITLPMLSPMILLCVVYSFTDSFYRAEITDTIYKTAFNTSKYGLSASMSFIYMVVCIAIIGITSFLVSRKVFYYDDK